MRLNLKEFLATSIMGLATVVTVGYASGQATSSLSAELVADGFIGPLLVTSPKNDPRLFVVEQGGRIRIIKDGNVVPTPFLDISARISSSGERGLLGLAFHPDYATNGFFYVDYTDQLGDTIIARFSVDPGNPDLADPSSDLQILTVDQPFSNHNGGMIAFSPNDGFLYIGMGDGGSGNDPGNRAQTITNQLLGKMLRIDIDSDDFPADPDRNYAIPADNPFFDKTGDDEIWAYGVRNPWRFSFDRDTGDLWIGDVGQSQNEEVDFQPANSIGGENYGWRCMEGFRCTGLSGCTCNDPGLTLPIHDYGHNPECSITGGYVYRQTSIPLLQGTYFFADFCSAKIWSMRFDGNNVSEFQERTAEIDPGNGLDIRSINSFGEDADGNLYIVDRTDGEVFRIVTDMKIDSTPLTPGKRATFRITGATPRARLFFVYSLKGIGDTTVPQLNVRLALQNPKLLGQKNADGFGTATLKRDIPANASGLTVWLQGAENGNTSNVIRRDIQ